MRLSAMDLRGITVLLLGTAIYLLLFTAFGVPKMSSHNVGRNDNFPRKIWQSWKVDSLFMEERDVQRARTWIRKNPTFRHEVLTDDNALSYVQQVFGPTGFNRPDVVTVYKSLQARIIQADLLRYIVMYAEGGIYADIDVEALKAFDQFVPNRFDEQELDMVIGVETDEPGFQDHPLLSVKAQSFCQWVFVCKPQLPVMLRLIDNIILWLHDLAAIQSRPISGLEFGFDEVLNGTGPSAFTAALLAEMGHTTGRKITWDDFHNLGESKTVGRVLVLPSEAFAAGTGHSQSGNHQSRGALVKHHFHASSWTKTHPRFKHPVYGEIEKCNWDAECVKLWDLNTAVFDALPQQEQLRLIEMKAADDAKIPKPLPDSKSPLIPEPQINMPTLPMADGKSELNLDSFASTADEFETFVNAHDDSIFNTEQTQELHAVELHRAAVV